MKKTVKVTKLACTSDHCQVNHVLYCRNPLSLNYHCPYCLKMLDNLGEMTITEISPAYRLIMHGLGYQFRYSKTTFDSYNDAKEAAAQASFAWGYPVEVEEVKE